MKKGWLGRTSCDEKNEEIAPFDWDNRSSDDNDDPVMLQIKWWSRLDEYDLTMNMTWRWRWLEHEDDLIMI